ncbi:hypothetical protein [Streptomyces sp. MMS20-AI2-20]|uniref:hypothetical protein n=1 Tax=Streptomyces sp. MMS20-AI2-20 TaxID=2925835 RepID=UPI001F62003F|nr:hypothetical protein [Streptomyces sp. MMS20-AI2-20]MCI4143019.1 hypothetical protein [Streptomyces sp. MMS20-AI2-20]
MSARRTALTAAYWTAVLLLAAVASLAAAIPFTGPAASAAGVIASGAVCLIGMACAPNPAPRKDDRA